MLAIINHWLVWWESASTQRWFRHWVEDPEKSQNDQTCEQGSYTVSRDEMWTEGFLTCRVTRKCFNHRVSQIFADWPEVRFKSTDSCSTLKCPTCQVCSLHKYFLSPPRGFHSPDAATKANLLTHTLWQQLLVEAFLPHLHRQIPPFPAKWLISSWPPVWAWWRMAGRLRGHMADYGPLCVCVPNDNGGTAEGLNSSYYVLAGKEFTRAMLAM